MLSVSVNGQSIYPPIRHYFERVWEQQLSAVPFSMGWPPRLMLKVTMPAIVFLLRDLRCGLLWCPSFLVRPQIWRARPPRIEKWTRSAIPSKDYADLGNGFSSVLSLFNTQSQLVSCIFILLGQYQGHFERTGSGASTGYVRSKLRSNP